MKTNMKKILIMVLLCFAFGYAGAQVILSNFSIQSSYTSNNKLLVNNAGSSTNFKVDFSLVRSVLSTGGFEPGECYVTVIYTESPNYIEQATDNNNYEMDSSTIELSSVKYVNSSNYTYSIANFYNSTALNATLPANKTMGKILLRYKAYDRTLGKDVTRYSINRYQIYVVPPPKIPIYLISYKIGTEVYNDVYQLSEYNAIPSGSSNHSFHSSGIDFKAYTSSASVNQLGAVPVYQYEYKVYDSNFNIGDPEKIFFYSTSNNFSPPH